MEYEEYIVSHEIKSEAKVAGSFYAFDLFFLLIYIGVSIAFGSLVYENLKWIYYIFSFIMAFSLTLPSKFNVKRRNYQSLIILFKKDDMTYRPVKNVSKIRNIQEGEL